MVNVRILSTLFINMSLSFSLFFKILFPPTDHLHDRKRVDRNTPIAVQLTGDVSATKCRLLTAKKMFTIQGLSHRLEKPK
jgi:hypothetical protein